MKLGLPSGEHKVISRSWAICGSMEHDPLAHLKAMESRTVTISDT
jgi:hypothetical protein